MQQVIRRQALTQTGDKTQTVDGKYSHWSSRRCRSTPSPVVQAQADAQATPGTSVRGYDVDSLYALSQLCKSADAWFSRRKWNIYTLIVGYMHQSQIYFLNTSTAGCRTLRLASDENWSTMSEKSSTNSKVHVMQSSSSESSCNDVTGSCDPDLQALELSEQLEHHREVEVDLRENIPRETGGKVEWCTECVRKGYTGHRCCDDVPGISRGLHQQASS